MNKFIRKFLYYKNKYINNKIIKHYSIKLDISNSVFNEEVKYAIMSCGYEIGPYRLIKKTLKKNDLLIELGSGIGFISFVASKIVGGENVICYEANPKLINIAKKNSELNLIYPLFTASNSL